LLLRIAPFGSLRSLRAGLGGCLHINLKHSFRAHAQNLSSEEIVEGLNGVEFVVANVEDGIELGDVQDIPDLLGEVEELEFAARVADRSEAGNQLADAGAVNKIHAGEIKDDLLLILSDEAVNRLAESVEFVAENDTAANVEDGDAADFSSNDLQGHDPCVPRVMAGMVVGGERQVNVGFSIERFSASDS
jgi:hypothetical protein